MILLLTFLFWATISIASETLHEWEGFHSYPDEPLENLMLDQWGADQGLPSELINDLLYSKYGYLYIATYSGLVRFDGLEFKVFTSADWHGLSGGVTALAEDESGALWVGTNGGGLNRYKDGNWNLWHTSEGLISTHLNTLFFDSKQQLWIGTKDGLCVLKKSNGSIQHISLGREDTIRAIHEDSTGSLWIGTRSQGLYKLNDNHEISAHYTSFESLPDLQVLSITSGANGRMWFGTTNGLLSLENGHWEHLTINSGLPGNEVVALHLDAFENLWALTNGGLCRQVNGQFSSLTVLSDLTDLVGDIVVDREQSMWIGAWRGGLFRLRNSLFGVVDDKSGLSNNEVNSVYEGADGGVYICGKGFLQKYHKGVLKNIHPDIFKHTDVRDCLVDETGRLWVMTHAGVFLLQKDADVIHYTTEDGLSSNLTRAGHIDASGRLWVGTLNGLNYFYNGKWIAMKRGDHGFSHDSFLSIAQSSDGRLWFTTDSGGINIWDKGNVQVLNTTDGLPSNLAFRLWEDSDYNMWIATNNGLACISPDNTLRTLSRSEGLPEEVILQVLADAQDQLWLLTNNGIYKVSRTEVLSVMRGERSTAFYKHVTKNNGLPAEGVAPGVSKSIIGSDGTLWIPTWNGLAFLSTKYVAINPYPPLVHINHIQVDNRAYEGPSLNSSSLEISPNPKKISFSFSAMGLHSPSETKVEAILEGFDSTWFPLDGERTVAYTNLDPGSYTFSLRATNEDQVPSLENSKITIIVQASLFQSIWFRTFIGCLLITVILSLYAYRIRSMRRRGIQLESLVEKRTQELATKANELEFSNDQLRHSFEALKSLNTQKTELLGVAAHDMKNPLNGIVGLSEILNDWVENSSNPKAMRHEIKEMVSGISASADHLNTIIDELLESAHADSGKVEFHKNNYDLSLIAKEVVELNNSQANAKSIEILLNGTQGYFAYVDSQRYREILDNLVSNAIKYSNPESQVWITLQLSPADPEYIQCQVKDQGPGLTDEDLSKLFQKFQKLSAQPTAGERSTGLGLSIVKSLTEQMGGKVWAMNNEDTGASFFVEFPLSNKSETLEEILH